jgi:hypothetical protein
VIQFKVKPHNVTAGECMEVWFDGVFVAAIYPTAQGIRVLSSHVDQVVVSDFPPAPVDEGDIVDMRFEFRRLPS